MLKLIYIFVIGSSMLLKYSNYSQLTPKVKHLLLETL